MPHKAENTFKYVPFTELLATTSVSLLGRQRPSTLPLATNLRRNDVDFDENDSEFSSVLDTLRELDLTEDFVAFLRDIPERNIVNCAQLLLYKDDIVDVLCRHMNKLHSLCYGSLFELAVGLAKDLQSDFYENGYFWRFFDAFVTVMEKAVIRSSDTHNNGELILKGFRCLAVLFKFVWRKMMNDLENAFRKFEPLFSHKRPYIRRFASEGFAFLLRKCKTPREFFLFALKLLPGVSPVTCENNDLPPTTLLFDGFAELIFQAIRGPSLGQFHSLAPQVLSAAIDACLTTLDAKVCSVDHPVVSVMEMLTRKIAAWSSRDAAVNPVANVYLEHLCKTPPESKSALSALLHCLHCWVEFRGGNVYADYKSLLSALAECLSKSPKECLELISAVLLMQNERIDSSVRIEFLRKITQICLGGNDRRITAIGDQNLTFSFLTSLVSLEEFDTVVLPVVFQRAQSVKEEATVWLELCAIYISDRRPITEDWLESAATSHKPLFHLLQQTSHGKKASWLVEIVEKSLEAAEISTDALACALRVVPFLPNNQDTKRIVTACTKQARMLIAKLLSADSAYSTKLLWLTCYALYSVTKTLPTEFVTKQHLLECLTRFHTDVHFLASVRLIVLTDACSESDRLSVDFRRAVLTAISPSLSDPLPVIRQTALRLLCAFTGTEDDCSESCFRVCLSAELSPLTLDEYRNRLLQLRLLAHNELLTRRLWPQLEPECKQAILRVMVTQLGEPFSLLWKPVVGIIESYAFGMDRESFWHIYYQLLQDASQNIADEHKASASLPFATLDDSSEVDDGRLLAAKSAVRRQLWTALGGFAHIPEAKTRQLVPMFIQIVREGFQKGEVKENLYPIEENDKDTVGGSDLQQHVSPATMVCAALEMFSKFRDPKSVYKESEIKAIYEDLLSSTHMPIQKLALSCLLTYKYGFMTPYRENLENLLDDKRFKDELVKFSLDEEHSVVERTHRTSLIPYLFRLLLGRLTSRKNGAEHTQAKRIRIYRFLAGCQLDELDVFIGMVFHPVMNWIEHNEGLNEMVDVVFEKYDVSDSIPLTKLQGLLHHLSMIIRRLSSSLQLSGDEKLLQKIYRIILCLSTIVTKLVDMREVLHPKHWKSLKRLRNLVTARWIELLSTFESLSYSREQLALFIRIWIEPQLDDGNNSINDNLLKLFDCWTNYPRYFPMLNAKLRCASSGCFTSAVRLLISAVLGANSSAKKPKKESVLNAVHRLITLADFVPSKTDGSALFVEPLVSFQEDDTDLNVGTKLLLAEVPTLLAHYESVFSSQTGGAAMPKQRDVVILERISEFADNMDTCGRLARLLIDCLVKSTNKRTPAVASINQDEIHARSLRAITLLVSRLDKGERRLSLVQPSLPLFGIVVPGRQGRLRLIELVAVIADGNSAWNVASDGDFEWIKMMNRFDPRRVEEPDYVSMIDGLSSISRFCRESMTSLNDHISWFLTAAAQNAYFLLVTTPDLSIRENAGEMLRSTVVYLSRLPTTTTDATKSRLYRTVTALIRKGLRNDSENIRNQLILVYCEVVRRFPSDSGSGGGCLVGLLDRNDVENDLFENLRHIQLHRKARAVRRLADLFNNNEASGALSADSMSGFLLPMVSHFSSDPNYAANTQLVEESIRCVGAVSSRLPWRRYLAMLIYYLRRVEDREAKATNQQRRIDVKLVNAVLDGFHFEAINRTNDSAAATISETVDEQTVTNDNLLADEEQMDGIKPSDASSQEEEGVKIFETIVRSVLPKLREGFNRKSRGDAMHKKAGGGKKGGAVYAFDEDNDLIRIPMAIATVKLLKKLPPPLLDRQLPSIILKMCQLLNSRSLDVRESARKTLLSVCRVLGARYFPFVVKELKQSLTKGYQVHVLIFTVHYLVSNLANPQSTSHDNTELLLGTGDLDSCARNIVEICIMELFGEASEEKEVQEFARQFMEARSNKTNETFAVLGRLLNANRLEDVLSPMREVLSTRQTSKTVRRASTALRHLAVGLANNRSLDFAANLAFVYRTLTTECFTTDGPSKEPIEGVTAGTIGEGGNLKLNGVNSFRPPSCLILPKEPGRIGAAVVAPKINKKEAASGVLGQFTLHHLWTVLKGRRVSVRGIEDQNEEQKMARETDECGRLDPFVALLLHCLDSKHDKIIALSLRCLLCLVSLPLPAIVAHYKSLVERLFVLLNRYAGAQSSQSNDGITGELTTVLFKLLTSIVKNLERQRLTQKQLEVLVHYMRRDLWSGGGEAQATAFSLLKAILTRGFEMEEVKDAMVEKGGVKDKSILAPNQHVRTECRHAMLLYLTAYPLGKTNPRPHIEFYLAQLQYEFEDGILSALEMLSMLIERLKQEWIDQLWTLCLVHLSLVLRTASQDGVEVVSEVVYSAKCQQQAASAIRRLFGRLTLVQKEKAVGIAIDWLKHTDKYSQSALGAKVLSEFVELLPTATSSGNVENTSAWAERQIQLIMPVLIDVQTESIRTADYEIFISDINHSSKTLLAHAAGFEVANAAVIDCLIKLLRLNTIWLKRQFSLQDPFVHQLVNRLWGNLPQLLSSGVLAADVRLKACQLVGQILSSCGESALTDPDIIAALRSNLCGQFRTQEVKQDVADQAIKNLVFLSRSAVTNDHPMLLSQSDSLRKICRWEIAKHPTIYIRRSSIFKWFGAILLEVSGKEETKALTSNLVDKFLPLLHREATLSKPSSNRDSEMTADDRSSEDAASSLKRLSLELLEVVKQTLGFDEYSRRLALCQRNLGAVRAERREQRKMEAVTDPEKTARRKTKKQRLKTESRKRRIDRSRPHRTTSVKRRKVNNADSS